MIERLRQFRKALGYDQKQMGQLLGIKQNTYSQIECGRRMLTERHIESLVDKANLNKDWLLNGTGEMFMETSEERELVEIFESLSPANREYLLKQSRILRKMEDNE